METEATKTCRILVVDDELYVCEAIKMVLELDGHEVTSTDNGADAFALHAEGAFDLVITDYSMPGMKGDELAAAMRARNPDQRIIMISAYVEKLTGEGTPLRNVDELLAKPFRLEDIKDAMRRVMNARAAA